MGEAIDESARTCRYCGEPCETERHYRRHLARAHDPAALSRIDRRRVETSFDGRTAVWADVLDERLAARERVGYLGSLRSPVPPHTLKNLALLGAGMVLLVTAMLAMAGP